MPTSGRRGRFLRCAERFTAGNKTEVVALALKSLLTRDERRGSLFGAHPGSVVIAEGVDLTEPVFDPDDFDALTGAEIDR